VTIIFVGQQTDKIMPLRPIFAEKFDVDNADRSIYHMLAHNLHPEAIRLIIESCGALPWHALSENEYAIDLIERNFNQAQYFVNWTALSAEPLAISLLERNKTRIDWNMLSINPAAMHLIERNPDAINWSNLSLNPSPQAMRLLERNLDKVCWTNLSQNSSAEAMRLLESNLDKIDWNALSGNNGASEILAKNLDKVDWSSLSSNSSPLAARLLAENPDRVVNRWRLCANENPDIVDMLQPHEIDWRVLSENPAAIHLLEANPDKICWLDVVDVDDKYADECFSVWCNPAIFEDFHPILK